ncbi:MAG: acetylxylan esterase [Thermoguttaceae bacterium]|jgi:hypothetical protein
MAADFQPNYDEGKVPPYTLPDPLRLASGQRVADAATWRNVRRPEILGLFEKFMYGKAPGRPAAMTFQLRSSADALDGKAVRKEVRIRFTKDPAGPKMDLLLYLPKPLAKPIPVFLGLNFDGNQAVQLDPGITISDEGAEDRPAPGGKPGATAKPRGTERSRWPLEMILARGYGLATAWYFDLEPDRPDGWRHGVRGALLPAGQSEPAPEAWGAIAAWAWGLSRAMDYLETDRDVDARHVAVLGHSRLGKTALWAGARDERFALVMSNDSGCGGASLARRRIGETVGQINKSFPHWFNASYKRFGERVDDLPVDQHMLLALVAPRPVYVASAEEDHWADPRGEFLSAKGADGVYRLLGTDGLAADAMPAVEHPVQSTIGYHIRRGKHDVTDYDWRCYLDFADRHFKR